MKLLTFYQNGQLCLGAKTDRGILDITAVPGLPESMDAFISGGAAARKRAYAAVSEKLSEGV